MLTIINQFFFVDIQTDKLINLTIHIFRQLYVLYLSFQEVDSDCFFIVSSKRPSAVTLNHTRFSDCAISHDHHLRKKKLV